MQPTRAQAASALGIWLKQVLREGFVSRLPIEHTHPHLITCGDLVKLGGIAGKALLPQGKRWKDEDVLC